MNKLLFNLLLVGSLIGCQKQDVDPRAVYTSDPNQAKALFTGAWKLTRTDSMSGTYTDQDVQLFITGNQARTVENGQEIDRVSFTIEQTPFGLYLQTTVQPGRRNWYMQNPKIQINARRMYLDTGMAQDFPGYEFERVR